MLQVHAPCPTGNNNNNNDTSAASVIITMKMRNGYVQRHRSVKCRVQNLSSSENVNINKPRAADLIGSDKLGQIIKSLCRTRDQWHQQ